MKKILGLLIVLIVFGLLGWQIYQRISESKSSTGGSPGGFGGGRGKPAVAVEIGEVRQQTIQDVGMFTGSLLPNSQFVVTPKVAGRLEQLLVDVGDTVTNGQLIATLDDEEFLRQVDKAKAELDVAKANLAESQSALEITKRELERSKALSQDKILSQSKLDEAQAAYHAAVGKEKVARATVTNREAGLQTAQLDLSYTQITAEWNGEKDDTRLVGERFVDEGALLRANDSIVSILDLQTIICEIHVIERDYFRLQKGQSAIISTDALPGRPFTGTIARIAPLLQETSRQARIEIEIPNTDEVLKPGMFVRVQIQFDNIENATVVPVSALVTREEQEGVFTADLQNMAAHFVPVIVGVRNSDMAQILEPPLSGSVVTMGQYLLEDGASILLPQEAGQHEKPEPSEEQRKTSPGKPE